MIQARHQECAEKLLRRFQPLLRLNYAFEIVDAVLRWNQRVGRAVIIQQLVAEFAERLEICVGCVGDGGESLLCGAQVAIEIEGAEVPVRIYGRTAKAQKSFELTPEVVPRLITIWPPDLPQPSSPPGYIPA